MRLLEEAMNNYDIKQVLPHQAPMILIDTLESYDVDSCRCTVGIKSASPFYDELKKGVPSYIGSEYMAQAIAAFAGAHALDDTGCRANRLFIGLAKIQNHPARILQA